MQAMSLLTDLFIASPNEIKSLNSDILPHHFKVLEARRIDTIKIAALDEILTGEGQEITEPIRASEDYEWAIFHIRPELRNALARLSSYERRRIALKWSQAQEWQLDGGTAEDLAQWLEEAGSLANQAEKESKEIYIRISL